MSVFYQVCCINMILNDVTVYLAILNTHLRKFSDNKNECMAS